MDGRVDGWTDGWMDGQADRKVDRHMGGWMNGWMDGQTEGWIDRRKAGRTKTVFFSLLSLLRFHRKMFAHSICTKPFITLALFSKFGYNLEQRTQVILPTKYTLLITYEY